MQEILAHLGDAAGEAAWVTISSPFCRASTMVLFLGLLHLRGGPGSTARTMANMATIMMRPVGSLRQGGGEPRGLGVK